MDFALEDSVVFVMAMQTDAHHSLHRNADIDVLEKHYHRSLYLL
jgi:hypothetical protein